jgi:hypothetical protein
VDSQPHSDWPCSASRLGVSDVALQLWARRPKQRDHADHVWPGHRRAREVPIASVAAVQGRAHVHPWRGNIRLQQRGSIEGARSAAAEARQRVAYINGTG